MYANASFSVTAAVGCALAIGIVRGADVTSPIDPCSLLTTAQVSSAIGGAADAGKPIRTTGCQWSSRSPKAMVTILFEDPNTFASMKAASSPGIVKTPLAGVGDDAFYKSLGTFTTLTVKKGHVMFVMHVYGFPDAAKQKEIEKSLATDVVARL